MGSALGPHDDPEQLPPVDSGRTTSPAWEVSVQLINARTQAGTSLETCHVLESVRSREPRVDVETGPKDGVQTDGGAAPINREAAYALEQLMLQQRRIVESLEAARRAYLTETTLGDERDPIEETPERF